QPHDSQHIRQRVHRSSPRSGVPGKKSGGLGMGRRRVASDTSTASGGRVRTGARTRTTSHKEILMHTMEQADAGRYAKCIEVSKRIRWDIDRDVIRGRRFDFSRKFLPDGISKVHELDFLGAGERRLLSQIQGRTYANMFGLVERFISAKVLEVSREHWL